MSFAQLELMEEVARIAAQRAETRQGIAAAEVVAAAQAVAAYPAGFTQQARLAEAKEEFAVAVVAAKAVRERVKEASIAAQNAWNAATRGKVA